jgi:hypothetical protein
MRAEIRCGSDPVLVVRSTIRAAFLNGSGMSETT